jgi:F420-non-reducing hydrogenase iron-sulfur subunit
MDRTNTVIALVCQSEKRKKLISAIQKKYSQIRIIPVICIGRLNPAMLFRLLLKDAKGVILIGCEPSDCHYREGVFFADRRLYLVKEVLKGFGMSQDLLGIIWGNPGKDKPILKKIDHYMEQLLRYPVNKGGKAS